MLCLGTNKRSFKLDADLEKTITAPSLCLAPDSNALTAGEPALNPEFSYRQGEGWVLLFHPITRIRLS